MICSHLQQRGRGERKMTRIVEYIYIYPYPYLYKYITYIYILYLYTWENLFTSSSCGKVNTVGRSGDPACYIIIYNNGSPCLPYISCRWTRFPATSADGQIARAVYHNVCIYCSFYLYCSNARIVYFCELNVFRYWLK